MVNLPIVEEQSVSSIVKLQQTVNRLFAIEDFEGAVPICEELCSEVSKVNGELHDLCAEPYYQYATALLELAREENQLLAQSKLDAGADEEDDEEEEEAVPAASSSSNGGASSSVSNGASSAPSSAPSSVPSSSEPMIDSNLVDSTAADLGNSSLTDTPDNSSNNSANADSTPSTSSAAPDSSVPDNDEESDEDITTLQIAWEVLELARVIYTRHTDNKSCRDLARVEVKLGEVCMENEKMDEAIEHFELAITTFIRGGCEAYSKDISSTYYLMGLAASLDQKYQAAKDHYTKCVQIMSASIMQLQSKEKTPDREAEISSRCGMKAEVQRMVTDCADSLKQMDQYNVIKQALAPMIQAAASSSKAPSSAEPSSSSSAAAQSNGFCTSSSTPSSSSVSNISHLVRKTPAASSTPSTPNAASSTPPASSPTVSSSSNSSTGKATLQVSPMVSSTSSLRPSSSQPFPSPSSTSSAVSSSLDRRMGSSTGFTSAGFGNSEAAAIPCTSSRPIKPLVSKPVRPIQRSGDISSSSDITAKRSNEVSEESNEAKRRRN